MPRPRNLSILIIALASLFAATTYLHLSPRRPAMGSATSPIRLAILEADTPQPKANAKYGGYRGVFTSLLESAAASLSPPRKLTDLVSISAYDVVNDPNTYPSLDDIDAILVTGSKHDAFRDDEWILNLVSYTKKAVDGGRVRVIGVCFGHQIVGRAMGALVGRSDQGWEIAVTDVELTDVGKSFFGLEKMRIHQMHKDIVHTVPEGASLIGSNAVCQVQGMYLPGRYITVQGHPEFTGEIVAEVVTNRHAAGVFTDDVFEDAMKRVPMAHDGVAIARAYLEFLQHG